MAQVQRSDRQTDIVSDLVKLLCVEFLVDVVRPELSANSLMQLLSKSLQRTASLPPQASPQTNVSLYNEQQTSVVSKSNKLAYSSGFAQMLELLEALKGIAWKKHWILHEKYKSDKWKSEKHRQNMSEATVVAVWRRTKSPRTAK